MTQSIQRQRRNEKTFEDLPPRVVIYDILNQIEIRLDSSICEFDLFGYYRRDSRRSIWYLFQSLDFSSVCGDRIQDNTSFPVVKIEKLHSLQWSENFKNKKVLKSFLETFKRTNMYLLKRLAISYLPCDSISGLFSSHNRFPKLTHLKIDADPITKDWNWDVDRIKSLQKTLISLGVFVDCGEEHPLPINRFLLLGNNATFSSLKKVSFFLIHFSNQRTIHLPHLEEVYLESCENLVVIPGSSVSSVRLAKIQPNDLRELFLRSKRIKHIELHSYELFNKSNNWFWEESTNPMENLHSLYFNSYYERNENFETFLERIKDQLIKFEVHWCRSLQEDILESGFKKLEVLKIYETPQLLQNETKWEFASQLKELTISRHPDRTFLRSILFKNNHFSSLEILSLTYFSYSETGISSLSFPLKNLKKLIICYSDIGDVFFAEQDFENLEILELYRPHGNMITGKDWKRTKFEKVRQIRVRGYCSVSNDLFKLIEFPALRNLELERCQNLTGEGWVPMPNLCEVSIVKCPVFSNDKILEKQNKGVK